MITIDVRKATHCMGDYSLYISFPYASDIIAAIRSFPSRSWNKDTKEWEVPVNKLDEFVILMAKYDIKITGLEAYEATQKKAKIDTNKVNYQFKTTPFQHQVDGFNYGIAHNCWLLGDEQGLGKTKQVIDIAVAKKQNFGYKHCLIVCGVNGLKWNWQNEISIHSNESGWILGQRKKKNHIVIGSSADKLADIKSLDSISDYFIITNVESLRNDEISAELKRCCASGKIELVAIDEIHKCKSPSSQQAKGILNLCAKDKIAMTGTPLMNSPLDVYIILRWLGYERHSFFAFKKHHCVMGGYGGYEIIGYKYMDEIEDILKTMMLRRLKDDVLDLPEKLYVDEFVDMTAKQAQIYKEVTMAIMANIDQIKMANNPLSELIRMRQATGYTGILSSTIQESAKLDRMEEIIEEATSNNKKVVIFSNWTQMTHAVEDRLRGKYKTAIITGETDDTSRQKMVEAFQNDDNCKVIVGTIGAMGTGLTLTAGTVMIFLDHPWNRALYDQAVDRCHRIGQKNQLTVYNMMCKDTIDERIWQLVQKKGAMSDALIDGKIMGNKTEILNFLLN